MEGQGTRFSDLSAEDKAKVVGGCVAAIVFFIAFAVFLSQDPLHIVSLGRSGAVFIAAALLLAGLFAFTVVPTAVSFLIVASFFVKYSRTYWAKGFLSVLAILGANMLFIASLMVLLSIFLANAPVEIQVVSIVIVIFGSGMLFFRIFLVNKRIGRKFGFIKEEEAKRENV